MRGHYSSICFRRKTLRSLLSILCVGVVTVSVQAQDTLSRHTVHHMFEVGHSTVADTYLSPLHYGGVSVGWEYEHAWRCGKSWWLRLVQEPSVFLGKNASGSGRYYGVDYEARLLWQRRWKVAPNVSWLVGGGAHLMAGVLHSTQNGNNPIQLHLGLNAVGASSLVCQFRAWGRPWSVCWNAEVDMLGIRFSPAFGQSYYELFARSDYDRNIRLVQVWDSPTFRNDLIVELPWKRRSWMLGYRMDCVQYRLGALKQLDYTHAFLIGWRIGR